MANLIVAGAAGRMGRVLIGMIARDPVHKLAGAVEATGVAAVGSDAGEVAGVGPLGLRITDDYAALARPDTVTLDFTNAAASWNIFTWQPTMVRPSWSPRPGSTRIKKSAQPRLHRARAR